MSIHLSHFLTSISFDKVAQVISSQYNLNKTLSKSRTNADVQPLNNITENPIIDKPMDVSVQQSTFNKDTSLSHMKDNRLLRPRKFRKTF